MLRAPVWTRRMEQTASRCPSICPPLRPPTILRPATCSVPVPCPLPCPFCWRFPHRYTVVPSGAAVNEGFGQGWRPRPTELHIRPQQQPLRSPRPIRAPCPTIPASPMRCVMAETGDTLELAASAALWRSCSRSRLLRPGAVPLFDQTFSTLA